MRGHENAVSDREGNSKTPKSDVRVPRLRARKSEREGARDAAQKEEPKILLARSQFAGPGDRSTPPFPVRRPPTSNSVQPFSLFAVELGSALEPECCSSENDWVLSLGIFSGAPLSLSCFLLHPLKDADLSHRASTFDPSASLLKSSVIARIQTATRPFRPTTLRSPLPSWRPRRIEHRCRPWTAPSRTTMKSMVTRPSGSKT